MSENISVHVNQYLKAEFDLLHMRIMREAVSNSELIQIIETQIRLAKQIIREERALNGESPYLLPPYMPKTN